MQALGPVQAREQARERERVQVLGPEQARERERVHLQLPEPRRMTRPKSGRNPLRSW